MVTFLFSDIEGSTRLLLRPRVADRQRAARGRSHRRGPTNKLIAQALFVTTKTVEVHLSNVYRKLGIGSRGESPQALSS